MFLVGFILGAGLATWSDPCLAYSANKVWMERLVTGRIRVHVSYTVPELKEFRESYVEFGKSKDAEHYYWDLIKGADFYPTAAINRRFANQVPQPDPW